MTNSFTALFKEEIQNFDKGLKVFFEAFPKESITAIEALLESIAYTLFTGGKRFRPVLSLVTARGLGIDPIAAVPFAVSVELIHTYSLIHDDLPCMDNASYRRGHPANHIKYGEATALLAGDALLSEAFTNIAESYSDNPAVATELVRLLGRASGIRGMVGGQAMDLYPTAAPKKEEWEITYTHNLKTGALIRASVEGAAVISECELGVRQALAEFGKSLGLAFQIADDLEDHSDDSLEPTSFTTVLGKERSKELLKTVTNAALEALSAAKMDQTPLVDITRYNLTRVD